jgi:hypothetical protein
MVARRSNWTLVSPRLAASSQNTLRNLGVVDTPSRSAKRTSPDRNAITPA